MPDAWVDPGNGRVVGEGLTVLVAAFVREQAVDMLPRGTIGTITIRFLSDRPPCIDAIPLLERSDQTPEALVVLAPRSREHAVVMSERGAPASRYAVSIRGSLQMEQHLQAVVGRLVWLEFDRDQPNAVRRSP